MKRLIIVLSSLLVFISQSAYAGPHSRFYDYGKVLRVTPVYHQSGTHHSSPQAQCYGQHQGHHSGYQTNADIRTVSGAVIGGVIGNTLGKNSKNRDLATVAGAVVGGVIGYESGQQHNTHVRHYNRYCKHSHRRNKHQSKLKGYEVTYRYKGEKFTTFTHQHPGNRIRLEVAVRPAMYK